jgi:hypothetical protein
MRRPVGSAETALSSGLLKGMSASMHTRHGRRLGAKDPLPHDGG